MSDNPEKVAELESRIAVLERDAAKHRGRNYEKRPEELDAENLRNLRAKFSDLALEMEKHSDEGQCPESEPASQPSERTVKRPYPRHPPCFIECRCDGNMTYAMIGSRRQTNPMESPCGYGETLPDALRALADELEREVGEQSASQPSELDKSFANLAAFKPSGKISRDRT